MRIVSECVSVGSPRGYAAALIAVCLHALLASCANPPPPAAQIGMAALPNLLAHARYDYPCGDPDPAFGRENVLSFFYWGNSEALRERIRLVEPGRLAYDGTAAAECLAAANCGNVTAITETLSMYRARQVPQGVVPEACQRVFVGQLPLGQPCEDDAECAVGRCWGSPTPTCRQPAAAGGKCGKDLPCAAGTLCAEAPWGKCDPIAPLPDGASCVVPSEDNGTSVLCGDTSPHWCANFLNYCNDMWCTVPDCGAGSYCAPTADGFGQCVPTLPLGFPCNVNGCATGGWCPGGVCVPLPLSHWGEPCGAVICDGTQYCDSNHVCTQYAHAGESCAGGRACVDTVCMASTTGKCSFDNPCGPSCPPASCREDGHCLAPRIGDACVADGDCRVAYQVLPILSCVAGSCHRVWNPASTWF